MEWFVKAVRDNYANFSGRARRKEYWMFYLFFIIFGVVAVTLDSILGTDFKVYGGISMGYGWISVLFYLAVLVPAVAVSIRRLHDINKSGWFLFISFIPLIGGIWIIILLATDGNKDENIYGLPTK